MKNGSHEDWPFGAIESAGISRLGVGNGTEPTYRGSAEPRSRGRSMSVGRRWPLQRCVYRIGV
jgi:hypothetical protein